MANTNNLRTYETICITKVDMADDAFNSLVERCKTAIEKQGKGKWLFADDWGKAKIAYTIGKDARGKWTYFRYESTGDGVDELERSLRINESVLRSLTTHTQADGKDYESLRATMAQDLQDREKMRDWRSNDDRGGRGGRGGYQNKYNNRNQNAEADNSAEDDFVDPDYADTGDSN